MGVPKKTLRIYSETDTDAYNTGKREESIKKTSSLLAKLGLKDVTEILFIGTNPLLDPTNSSTDILDMKVRPYSVYSIYSKPPHLFTASELLTYNQQELIESIDQYVERNMDTKALAVVHSTLVDYVSLLLDEKFNTQVVMATKKDTRSKRKPLEATVSE